MGRIISDFEDYYDKYFEENIKEEYAGEDICFVRKRAYVNKVLELKALKDIGIPVINIEPINKIFNVNNKDLIVVYTDISGHNGNGKLVLDFNEANMLYSNRLCSKLSKQYDGYTYKFLQVGQRKFWLVIENDKYLRESRLVKINEFQKGYTRGINIPIFSIDYTLVNGIQTAVDFNTAQNLSKLNFKNYMSEEEVSLEIYNCLKVRRVS